MGVLGSVIWKDKVWTQTWRFNW